MKKANKEISMLVQPYKRGFETKIEAMKQIKAISTYFNTVNEYNSSSFNSLTEKEFIQMIENGTPHTVGSWLNSKRMIGNIQDYRTDILCFDIDNLGDLPERAIHKVIALLNQYFHYVQESFSSGKKLFQKRYHCYLRVTTLQVDYEVIAMIYKQVRDDISAKIGIQFDESMHPLKTIFASKRKVKINRTLKVFDLKPYLNAYIEKKREMKQSISSKMKDSDVVNAIVDEHFNKKLKTTKVNFDELLKTLKSEKFPFISEYKEWIHFLMAFNNMEKEGLITSEEKMELAEAIDDGNKGYVKEFEKLKRYDRVTIGSLIYRLQQYGIRTDSIFTSVEKYQLRIDYSFDIQGKITENQEVFRKLEEILYDKENRGKRILLYSDTGTGKSTAILKMIEKMTTTQTNENTSNGFAILSIPRRNLINNLQNRFETIPKSSTVTGSDKYTSGEREKTIQNATNILTTLDHNPYVLQLKLNEALNKKNSDESFEEDRVGTTMISVLDECHMLSSDATFKSETIREFCIAETALLHAKGVSLHVTGTPENLRSEDYDLIIKINQEKRENPFSRAGYLLLDGLTKQVENKMLEVIKLAARKDPKRKLLVFIENKELIYSFSNRLNKDHIQTMAVVSQKEELKSEEEKMVVKNRKIPKNVQVILATTCLSTGVSIENNQEVDEIWVFCSSKSINHEMTRIAQMSHRFRNKYHALKLFIQKGRTQETKKRFMYHTFLNEDIKKAKSFKKAIEILRENQLEGRMTLDELELQNGLFADEDGKLHVCTPLIQSELVQDKTYYNYSNPDVLIWELEKKFQSSFVKMDGNIEVKEREEAITINQNESSEDILRRIIEEETFYNQLKNEYFLYGKSHFSKALKRVKLSTRKDLEYFFQSGCNYVVVRKVIQAHLNAPKGDTLSYIRDKDALEWMKRILRSKENTLSVRMYKEIKKHLTLSRKTNSSIQFASIKEIESYVQTVVNEILKEGGMSFSAEDLKVESFKKLLKIEKQKSGNVRSYTIVGFIDETCIMDRYGITKIV